MSADKDSGGQGIEDRIDTWRAYLLRRQSMRQVDVDELECHLRDGAAELAEAGLAPDEAFLVAVKRIGALHEVTREFAREHSERLWKQLVPPGSGGDHRRAGREPVVAIALAMLAAAAFKVPALLGVPLVDGSEGFYLRNVSFFALPCLFAYFAWKRRIGPRRCVLPALAFLLSAVLVNVYPLATESSSLILVVLHLPIALWLAVGVGYAGGHWDDAASRMNFIRFTGELVIYFVLIGLGGGVLTGITMATFAAIGIDAETVAQQWIIPCGALGAVVVAAWLVEAKQSVIENMAPVLTRVFTPLFAFALLVLLGSMVWTGNLVEVDREVLIGFDLLLVVVLGLLLYAVSARDPLAKPDAFDALQLVLVACALVVDLLALSAIAARISEFGFSANKVAALGENLVLLVNLAWSAWLYLRFLRGRGPFSDLERWQTAYLPVYAAWAGIVAFAFPPLFRFS